MLQKHQAGKLADWQQRNAIVNGLSEDPRDDRKLLQQSACIFDGLLALFAQQRARKVRQRSKK